MLTSLLICKPAPDLKGWSGLCGGARPHCLSWLPPRARSPNAAAQTAVSWWVSRGRTHAPVRGIAPFPSELPCPDPEWEGESGIETRQIAGRGLQVWRDWEPSGPVLLRNWDECTRFRAVEHLSMRWCGNAWLRASCPCVSQLIVKAHVLLGFSVIGGCGLYFNSCQALRISSWNFCLPPWKLSVSFSGKWNPWVLLLKCSFAVSDNAFNFTSCRVNKPLCSWKKKKNWQKGRIC